MVETISESLTGGFVRILLWHGYLLSGSGSNLSSVNLARIWRSEGHDVLLMCQERHAEEFEFVDAFGEFSADNKSFIRSATNTNVRRADCRCSVPT